MNDLFSQIAIVAWGCKGGCRTFCDNRVVDVLAPNIRTTLKDIRSFITISKPAMDFYALEYTTQYKVFTQYRSSNDSGNGAFIAFTLMVPHKVKVRGMRTLLNEMMKDYFKEYMNPLNFSPLSGKYDDINKYISILRQHEQDIVPDVSHYSYAASVQDDRPRLVVYDDVSAVDDYFESPYRPEFFSCQEVMFLSSDLYNNQSKYEVRFQVEPVVIANVSDPIPESQVYQAAGTPDYKVTRFTINGANCLGTHDKLYLPGEARIDLSIGKEHYMPRNWVAVSAAQLVEAGIFVSRGRDFVFASHFELMAKRYFIKVVNDDEHCDTRDLLSHLLLSDGARRYPMSKTDTGDFGFLFAGDWVERTYQLEYYIPEFKNPADCDTTGLVKLQDLKPADLVSEVNPTILLHVHQEVLRLRAVDREPAGLMVTIQSPSLDNPISLRYPKFKEKLVINLPTRGLQHPRFDVEADQFDCDFDGGEFILTPRFKVFTLKVRRQLREVIGSTPLAIQYQAKDQTLYDGVACEGRYEFTLPYRWRDNMGQLLIQGRPFGIVIDDDELTFNSSVIVNKASKGLDVKCHIRDGNDTLTFTMPLEPDGYLLLPEGSTFEIPDEVSLMFKTREHGHDNGIYRVDVESRVSRYMRGPAGAQETPTEPSETPEVPTDHKKGENSAEATPEGENPVVEEPIKKAVEGTDDVAEEPKTTTPAGGTPKAETTQVETRADETPKEENAKVTTPVIEPKKEEKPREEKPKEEARPTEYWVTLRDCEDLFVHLKTRRNGIEHVKRVSELFKKRIQVMQDCFKIYNKNDREVCAVYFPKETYYQVEKAQEAENRKNGFVVKWSSESECQITYSPMSVFSRLMGAFDRKWLFGILALLICVAGALAYTFFSSSVVSVPQLVINFSTNDNSKIERVVSTLPGLISNEGARLIIERQEDQVKDSLSGLADMTISVFYEGSDRDIYTMQEISWPDGGPQQIRSFLEGKGEAGTIDVVIVSPGEKMLQSLREKFDAGTCTIQECADAAQKYKAHLEAFAEMACQLARADDFARMDDFARVETIFADTEPSRSLMTDYQVKQGAKEVEAAKAAEKAGLRRQYDALVASLGTLSCSSSTVDKLETFIQSNADYNTPQIKRRISQYRMVFAYPSDGPIVSRLDRGYFSANQWKLLEKYVVSGSWDGKPINFTMLDKKFRESGGTY